MKNTASKFRKALNDAAEAIKRFSSQLDKVSERWKIVPLIKFPSRGIYGSSLPLQMCHNDSENPMGSTPEIRVGQTWEDHFGARLRIVAVEDWRIKVERIDRYSTPVVMFTHTFKRLMATIPYYRLVEDELLNKQGGTK